MESGPPLTGHGAEVVRTVNARSISELSGTPRRPLVREQRAEMTQHARLRLDSGKIYFRNPQSPWQRGSSENTTDCFTAF